MPALQVTVRTKDGTETVHPEVQIPNTKPLVELKEKLFKKVGIKTEKRWRKYAVLVAGAPIDWAKTTKELGLRDGSALSVVWAGGADGADDEPVDSSAGAAGPTKAPAAAPAAANTVAAASAIDALLGDAAGGSDSGEAGAPETGNLATGASGPFKVASGAKRGGVVRKKKEYKKVSADEQAARRAERTANAPGVAAATAASAAASSETAAAARARAIEAALASSSQPMLSLADDEMLAALTPEEAAALAAELAGGPPAPTPAPAPRAATRPFDRAALREAMRVQALASTVGADYVEFKKDPTKTLRDWAAEARVRDEAAAAGRAERRSASEVALLSALEALTQDELDELARWC